MCSWVGDSPFEITRKIWPWNALAPPPSALSLSPSLLCTAGAAAAVSVSFWSVACWPAQTGKKKNAREPSLCLFGMHDSAALLFFLETATL